MLMHPYNELRLDLKIKAVSPLLIKESRYGQADRERLTADTKKREVMPNVIPISRATQAEIDRAVMNPNPFTAVEAMPFYLPAASLRGVCRSHLERVLRTFDNPEDPRICDPFEDALNNPTLSCSTALTERRKTDAEFHPYRHSCPVCRLFGSTLQASRIGFSDGERVGKTGRLVQREHVRIDRRKGSVTGAPLKFLALEDAEFTFTITLSNFELSHLVLMGVMLGNLKGGNLTFGSGRSKGYGRVALAGSAIHLRYFGLEAPADRILRGVAEHTDPRWSKWFQERYGVQSTSPEKLVALERGDWKQETPWRWELPIALADFEAAWPKLSLNLAGAKPLADRLVAQAHG
ncbi:MAG: hypothetical protein K2X03_01505 [Bryobacteraceae bacterium]|nr:hypothetical protein [Bryobacteraceae bacterium]